MRFLTFVHRSPYATWNSLSAWIRHERRVPDEVVLAHIRSVTQHADLVERGVRFLVEHYGGRPNVKRLPVQDNRLDTWLEALRPVVSDGRCTIDVTGARTVPKLAAAQLLLPGEGHEAVYLDVEGYRYEPKPFAWLPYNLQTIRFLGREKDAPKYRQVQYLGEPPGTPPIKRLGVERVTQAQYEASVPWEALVVLLNEAGAAGKGKTDGAGVEEFQVKLPALGVTVARYNLETRRFRLEPWRDIQTQLATAHEKLDGMWRDEVPSADFILEALASARLLPFTEATRYARLLHEVASETRGPNPGTPLRAIGLDTNLFYLDFFTAITHAARVPMTRVPVVASEVSIHEIRAKMKVAFPRTPMPAILERSHIHHPHQARKAHAAHEEFEMLRNRCRMHVIRGQKVGAGGPTANDRNDEAILLDFSDHHKRERQELLVLSNDRGFVDRAHRLVPGLTVEHVQYADPNEKTAREADVDQVAYFVYRLALGYGLVSLKGLEVEVLGDHPPDQHEGFLHEDVRLRVPDRPWVRGFLHERQTREPLRQMVAEAGVWL